MSFNVRVYLSVTTEKTQSLALAVQSPMLLLLYSDNSRLSGAQHLDHVPGTQLCPFSWKVGPDLLSLILSDQAALSSSLGSSSYPCHSALVTLAPRGTSVLSSS